MGSLVLDGRDATGTLYRRNRYYDPASGRFTQEDPIGVAGGVNLYGYGQGDPVNNSDPFGLCSRADNYKDCEKMISARQSMQLLVNAIVDGEWTYTQGGAQGGKELRRNVGARAGDCTDFTFAMTLQTVGSEWGVEWGSKSSTTGLWNGTAKGYTQIDASAARPGDIVVNGAGRHAGAFIGRDRNGHAWGWANNGRPATPTAKGNDSDTGAFDFGSQPRFLRPIVP